MSNEHKARNKKGSKNMPWRSEIWAGFELDFGLDQETLNPQAEAWIERIVQEPWVAALLRLVAKDAWVGSEERLLDELKAFAGEGVCRSSDFPRTLGELHNYIASGRGWTCPDSVDTFPLRSILCSQFNLLELSGA